MRKKILGIAVMAVVAVAAAWNINQSENEIKLSDLALDNVEANFADGLPLPSDTPENCFGA